MHCYVWELRKKKIEELLKEWLMKVKYVLDAEKNLLLIPWIKDIVHMNVERSLIK